MTMLFSFLMTFSSAIYAQENSTIKTDLKFLCEINKIEKSLSKDKSIDAADLAERIASMQEAAFKDPATKKALPAILTMAPQDRMKTWKQFAKDNKVKASCF